MAKFLSSSNKKSTICPHCYKNSYLEYVEITFHKGAEIVKGNFFALDCASCHDLSLYRNERIHLGFSQILIYPLNSSVLLPPPPETLDDEMKVIYREAMGTYDTSPRSSCALVRLVLQAICDKNQCKGRNLLAKINSLAEKYKFDIDGFIDAHLIRYGGNDAVHELQLDLNETAEDALFYFEVLNNICQSIALAEERNKKFSRIPTDLQNSLKKDYKKFSDDTDK